MARRRKITPRSTTVRKGLHFRKVPIYIDVARVPPQNMLIRGPFYACVKIGSASQGTRWPRWPGWSGAACASGRNPRRAVAAALRKGATKTSKRGGAFAGLGWKE